MTETATTSAKSVVVFRPDTWLSDVCQRPVARVTGDPRVWRSPGAGERLLDWLAEMNAEFAYAKVAAGDVAAASVLQDIGFRVVDVNITLAASYRTPAPEASVRDVEVVEVATVADSDADSHELACIAGECFRYSRFHLDPQFDNALAGEIKRQWVANYLRGARGDRIWGARVDGQWAGFLAAIRPTHSDAAVIDLIGVDAAFQGRGVGSELMRVFMRHYANSADMLRVGTQAANAPSIRLYEKMGFRFEEAAFVLHWKSAD